MKTSQATERYQVPTTPSKIISVVEGGRRCPSKCIFHSFDQDDNPTQKAKSYGKKKCSLQKPNILQYQDQNCVLINIHSSQTVQFPGLYSQAEAPPPHPNWIHCCSLHPQEQMSTGLLMQVHLTPSIGSTWVVRKAVPVSLCSPLARCLRSWGFFLPLPLFKNTF